MVGCFFRVYIFFGIGLFLGVSECFLFFYNKIDYWLVLNI